MTKRSLFIMVLLGISFSALSQKNNEIKVNYGFPEARMRWNVEVFGASSNQLNSALDFGIRYRRQINESWGFITGLPLLSGGENHQPDANRDAFSWSFSI